MDVHTLAVDTLYEDANGKHGEQYSTLLPGAHGKGLSSGQGILVYSNNGEPSEEAPQQFDIESGVLAEWDGNNWKVGKPTSRGGPWKNTFVKAGRPSDPYLIGFYDKKSLELSHDSPESATFDIEMDPVGHGPWMLYQQVTVGPGDTWKTMPGWDT